MEVLPGGNSVPYSQPKTAANQSAEPPRPADAASAKASALARAAARLAATDTISALGDLLRLAGLKNTPANARLAQALATQGLAATAGNLTDLNRAMTLMGGDLDQALFLLKNELPVSTDTANKLKGYIRRETRLSAQIQDFAASVEQALADVDSFDRPADAALRKALAKTVAKTVAAAEWFGQNGSAAPEDAPAAESTGASTTAEGTGKPAAAQKDDMTDTKTALGGVKKALAEINALLFRGASPEAVAEKTEAVIRSTVTKAQSGDVRASAAFQTAVLAAAADLFGEQSDLFAQIKKGLESGVREAVRSEGRADATQRTNTPDRAQPANHTLKEQIVARFALDPAASDGLGLAALHDLANDLRETVRAVKALFGTQVKEPSPLLRAAEDIAQNLDFLDALKDSVYTQIPLHIGDKPTTAELFVFRGKKQRQGGAAKEQTQSSALIALDLLSFGHLETYVQKTGRGVSIQFRVETDAAETLIRQNAGMLNALLAQKDLSLIQCAYHQIDQPFLLTDKEPAPEAPRREAAFRTVDRRV